MKVARYLFCLLVLAPFAARAGQLTLDQAFDRALAGNLTVKAVEERIRQAEARVSQARAGYLPRFDIGARGIHRDISRNEALAGMDRRSEVYDGFLTGKWVLFSGFSSKYTLAAARLDVAHKAQGRNEAVRNLFSAVAQAFHRAQLALANRLIAESDRDFYDIQLKTAQIKQKAGVGSVSDVLNINTRMNQAMIEMEQYLAEYDVARAALAALLGEDGRDLPEPVFPEDETPKELAVPDPDRKTAYALDHRPDLAQLSLSLEMARARAQAARSSFYPELSLNGSIGADRTGSAGFEAHDLENSLGLELTYPLFAGGRDRAAVREALSAAAEAELALRDLRIQAMSQVRQDCFSVAAAQKQLTLYRENAKLVERNRDMVAKEYQAGKTSLVNLNEVQTSLTQTRHRIALSLISLRQAWYGLKSSTGAIQRGEALD